MAVRQPWPEGASTIIGSLALGSEPAQQFFGSATQLRIVAA